MTIDVSRLETLASVAIGSPPNEPLYEGDTLEDVTIIAEGFTSDGTPIDPAPFATDDGGWGAEVVMDAESTLAVTVNSPLADDGQVILSVALGESTDKVGIHRGNVRIYNPIAGRTQQRTLFNFMIQVTEAPP